MGAEAAAGARVPALVLVLAVTAAAEVPTEQEPTTPAQRRPASRPQSSVTGPRAADPARPHSN